MAHQKCENPDLYHSNRAAYVVWDTEQDKAVPFGRHTRPDHAKRHIDRLNGGTS